ncbi:MAG: DUF2380 domain-containing protein [Methylococcaceae bacterium]|nr:MAG: DUF2380 domain-containing protein [Methylococcaceae bacterium]
MRFVIACLVAVQLLFLSPITTFAGDARVAVLDFELNDVTLNPNIPEEIERTASIKSLLQKTLATKSGYTIVEVAPEIQKSANAGHGYLSDHHDVAAQLGRDVGADWVIVGRVHKASFLFVYLKAHVVNAKTGQLVGDLIIEIKGPQKKLTIKGVESLAEQIDVTLQRSRSKEA